MPTDHFAGDVARGYDGAADPEFRPDVVAQTVAVLAELADRGPVVEFAVGTGRIALPLAERGIPVSGIEFSSDMVAQLRAKPGGDAIPVVVGDMSSARVEGEFGLVVLVFNTIGNLTEQDAQVACFRNAARHLRPGGRFVIETTVPPLQRLPVGERFVVFDHEPDHVGVDEIDVVTQAMTSHHHHPLGGTTIRTPFRYAWPAELDLMARLAGLRLEHRWSGWDRRAFTATSTSHISVWLKDADGLW